MKHKYQKVRVEWIDFDELDILTSSAEDEDEPGTGEGNQGENHT